ncbi:SWIM zinc finger family protein [Enorma phocaeensis]|uniref:SWIM zinc finger family protein n=1 Tax=Enorma phocaeensis TaxID=1871019 RepID=A0ABT7V8G9_9ACTN|nr:SWIM zinc finger family protein [Enorma phocaeensis]
MKNLRPGGEGVFDAEVEGTANLPYTVHVDTVHVRQSHCDCPHAAGTKRICKHMVATVFTAYPQQVDAFKWEVEQEELAFQREEEAHRAELVRYVNSLKKDELREALLAALIELEERQDRWW